jgi:hypothetical protein
MNPEEHLDLERLHALLDGELAEAEARAARVHLAGCGFCQAEVELAGSFREASSEPLDRELSQRLRASVRSERGVRRTRRVSPQRQWLQRGLLAASLILAALGIREILPAQRGSTPTSTLRAFDAPMDWALELGELDGGWQLQWQAIPGAREYLVRVQSSRGDLIWESRTAETKLRLERADITGDAEPGSMFFVTVVTTIDGQEQSSPPMPLQL